MKNCESTPKLRTHPPKQNCEPKKNNPKNQFLRTQTVSGLTPGVRLTTPGYDSANGQGPVGRGGSGAGSGGGSECGSGWVAVTHPEEDDQKKNGQI
jgi:hypothetical protein